MHYSDELVLRANQLYHDIAAGHYAGSHPEIFRHLRARWQRTADRFMASRPPSISLLDVGSGTGFVPLQIAQFLDKRDGGEGRGSDLLSLLRQSLTEFEFVHLETYRHLAKVTYHSRMTAAYDRLLAQLWPNSGSTFFAVFRKYG